MKEIKKGCLNELGKMGLRFLILIIFVLLLMNACYNGMNME